MLNLKNIVVVSNNNDGPIVNGNSVNTAGGLVKLNSSGTVPETLIDQTKITSKADLVDGKVPASQLPSYVDDVVEGYIDLDNVKFYSDSEKTEEVVVETGKIYIDLTSNLQYRFSGTTFAVMSSSLALGETSTTAFPGDRGKAVEDALANIDDGADVNVIEVVKVNGTALTVTDKAVDVTVPTNNSFTLAGLSEKSYNSLTDKPSIPTKISDLTNDSNFVEKDGSKVLSTNDYTTTEKNKLAGIAESANVNTIESVKVDGVGLTIDANKAVNIDLSGKADVSDLLTLGETSTTAFPGDRGKTLEETVATIEAASGEANIIENVKVNGTALTVTDKAVDVTVPTKVSDLTNDSGFMTSAEITALVNGKLDAPSVDKCTNIRSLTQGTSVRIKWKDPEDLVVEGVTLATWNSTVLVRKVGSYPTSVTDGTVIVTSSTRDQYNTTAYVDTLPDESITYYYQLFPKTTQNVYNTNTANRFETSSISWTTIHELVQNGEAESTFSIGDVLTTNHSVYGEVQWQIVAFDQAEAVDTSVEHSMTLLSVKCLGTRVWDASEKQYALTDDTVFHSDYYLTALKSGASINNSNIFTIDDKTKTGYERSWTSFNGTYKFRYNSTSSCWESKNISNGTIDFTSTTTNEDISLCEWSLTGLVCEYAKKYYTYSEGSYLVATVTDGDEVTSNTYYEANPTTILGTNHRSSYGYNNWKQSNIRQWLNATTATDWFVAQNIFDNCNYTTTASFMSGFTDSNFLSCVAPVKIVTARNTITDQGGYEVTEDKFWLPSNMEMFGSTNNSISEGVYWSSVFPDNASRVKYNGTSASLWWLRSPDTGIACSPYVVYSSGSLSSYSACSGVGLAPACVII